jgi:hypothetical protein
MEARNGIRDSQSTREKNRPLRKDRNQFRDIFIPGFGRLELPILPQGSPFALKTNEIRFEEGLSNDPVLVDAVQSHPVPASIHRSIDAPSGPVP